MRNDKSSNRFFQRKTIISFQQVSDILSAGFLFYHSCKLLYCELWVTNNNCLNHCSGGTADRFFKPGSYFKNVEAEMVSYDFVMPSSFNAYVQTLKYLLHEIRKVIHKTSQRLGDWKQKEIKLTMQKFYLAKWVQVRVSTKGTVNFNCCQFWSDLSDMRSPKPPHLSICLSVCTCQ